MTAKDRDAEPTIRCECCKGFGIIPSGKDTPFGPVWNDCPLCGGAGYERADVHPREPSTVTPRTEKTP